MTRSLRSPVLAIACAMSMALAPTSVSAQTTAASTFGPGDSYNTGIGWTVSPFQSVAQGFLYAGENAFLSQVRLALFPNFGSTYDVFFGTGANMNAVTQLESWLGVGAEGGIVALASSVMPLLMPGNMYWLWTSSEGQGAWFWNDQGYLGHSYRLSDGIWNEDLSNPSSAYDVTVNTAAVPEPASLLLFGSGLTGLLIRRRRKSISVA